MGYIREPSDIHGRLPRDWRRVWSEGTFYGWMYVKSYRSDASEYIRSEGSLSLPFWCLFTESSRDSSGNVTVGGGGIKGPSPSRPLNFFSFSPPFTPFASVLLWIFGL